ncbi:uncharacterized protein MELLADRAFT_123652 [Melampsora larici-populina 98AG31]|uniref:Secreted protein n=1 Tax=Melampsora larici-populina (strain 98AG31 / pathotype 3-4-7) TaxID=747676 RepID=F4RGC7_MELLP|nr:uncharacterized protein MELLADRAFT_123652 [Melampsora larici-populina 98AG31]EGG08479.1 secreted protein [Melampsora larici-populina 98AG31]
MLNLQRFVVLALAAMISIARAEFDIQCQNVTTMINATSCQNALDLLKPDEKNGRIVRDESAYQLTCGTCKVDIVTMNHGALNVDAATVQTELTALLAKCPGDGASVLIPHGSDLHTTSDQAAAKLSISYPDVVHKTCSVY